MHQFVNLLKFISFEIYSKWSKVLSLVLLIDVGIIMNRAFGIMSIWLPLDVNGITWDTHAYFLTNFVIAFWEIILKSFWKSLRKIPLNLKNIYSYYFIKIHVKNLAKKVIFRKMKFIYKSFHFLKTNITMFNELFVYFLFIGLISNLFTCSHVILKIQLYTQILQFQHQNKLWL
jgi:hypothetical protein